MAYKQFSYSGSNKFGSYTAYARVYYSENYNASTNKTTVSLSSVDFYVSNSFGSSPCHGTVSFAGTTVKTFSGGYTNQASGGGWNEITNSSGGSVTVSHSTSGTATMSMSIDIYVLFNDAKFYVDDSGSVNLTTHTSTLTVNPNGGTWNGSTSSQNFSQAPTSSKTIANPSRTGYTFDGWTKSGGGSLSSTTYTFGSSNGTLAANWQINTWAVDYDANGGSGAPASQTKTYGQTLVLSADVPTRTGYTFKGWATTSEASVAQYQPSGNYTANQAATLYAVWQINQYSLSITKSEAGLTLNVTRTESPIAGAATGILSNGAVIYYGDKLTVAYALSAGYAIDTATINGVDMGGTSEAVTVSSNVAVIVLVELQALAYIDNGASIDMYQIYIDDGNSFSAYQAYIDNGVSWDVY